MLKLLLLGSLVVVQPVDDFVALGADGGLVLGRDLVLDLIVVNGLLHLESVRLQFVLGLDALLGGLVLLLVLFGLVDHSLDILLGEAALVVGNGDLVLLASALILGGDVQDTVGVNIEGNLDLWDAAWCWWNAGKFEFSEQVVILGHGALTLEDLDQDTGLVIRVGGEGLGLLGWDSGVALDQCGHDTASGFNTHGEWGNIEEKEILDFLRGVTRKNGGLNGGTVGNGLVRVDGLVQLLAIEVVLEELLDLWNTSGATNQNDLVDSVLK